MQFSLLNIPLTAGKQQHCFYFGLKTKKNVHFISKNAISCLGGMFLTK